MIRTATAYAAGPDDVGDYWLHMQDAINHNTASVNIGPLIHGISADLLMRALLSPADAARIAQLERERGEVRDRTLADALAAIDDCFITPDNDREEGLHDGVQSAYEAVEGLRQAPPDQLKADGENHPDDAAVDRFAAAMKAKLKYAREVKGRGGWDVPEKCLRGYLSRLMREHIAKGDPVDVAAFAMMLHQRGLSIQPEVGDEALPPDERARLTSAGEKLDQALGEFIDFSDFEMSHDPDGEKWVSMHTSHWEALLSDARDARAAWSAVDRPEADDEAQNYLVWSNKYNAWWRSGARGYTRNVVDAGAYSRSEAVSISHRARDGWREADVRPDEIAVCEGDLPPNLLSRRKAFRAGQP